MRLDATMALGRRPERARRGNIDFFGRGGSRSLEEADLN
jgi:hypothetical protein